MLGAGIDVDAAGKRLGAWGLEFRPDFDAHESGMDIFINWNKDFVGKAASLAAKNTPPKQKLVTMVIDVTGIDVCNDEAILKDGKSVGYVSSGGYAHRVQKSMAMGYVKTDYAHVGTQLQIEILGEFYDAQVLGGPIYDSNGANMRS